MALKQKNPTKANRNFKLIRQAELQAVVDMDNATETLRLNIRRMLQAGAAVEPGRWTAFDDGSSIEQFEAPCAGGYSAGLDISPVEVAATV